MTQPDPPRRPEGEASQLREWHRMTGAGLEFAVAVAGLGLLGWWLDGVFDTAPWLLFAGIALGFGVGLYLLVRMSRKMFK